MTPITHTYTLADGHVLELFEPESSGRDPMMRGRCPGCHEQLYNFTGRNACIRELDHQGLVVASTYASNFGHLPCVETMFINVVKALQAPDTVPYGLAWTTGTQRQMIEFIQRNDGSIIEIVFDSSRGRTSRYDFRVQE
jgi:hypothetical protein